MQKRCVTPPHQNTMPTHTKNPSELPNTQWYIWNQSNKKCILTKTNAMQTNTIESHSTHDKTNATQCKCIHMYVSDDTHSYIIIIITHWRGFTIRRRGSSGFQPGRSAGGIEIWSASEFGYFSARGWPPTLIFPKHFKNADFHDRPWLCKISCQTNSSKHGAPTKMISEYVSTNWRAETANDFQDPELWSNTWYGPSGGAQKIYLRRKMTGGKFAFMVQKIVCFRNV